MVPNTGKGTNAETRPRVSEGKSACLANKPGAKHRLRKALRLIICEVPRRDSEALVFLRQLAQSSAHPGVAVPADNMPHTSPGGRGMQTNGVFIPFHPL